MKLRTLVFTIFLLLIFGNVVFAQARSSSADNSNPAKATPAFAEVLLRKTELESELEELLVSYKEEYPKVKDARYELSVLQKELDRILKVKPAETGKLTTALGKLMVRKAEIETDYWSLKNRYSDEHPQTKRAKRKLEIFDKAINEIM
ncbi:MAG: hypothetical protein ACR2MD_18550 [Aridibacter sp.]